MVIAIGIVVGMLTVCVLVGMIWGARGQSTPLRPSRREAGDRQGEQLSTDPH